MKKKTHRKTRPRTQSENNAVLRNRRDSEKLDRSNEGKPWSLKHLAHAMNRYHEKAAEETIAQELKRSHRAVNRKITAIQTNHNGATEKFLKQGGAQFIESRWRKDWNYREARTLKARHRAKGKAPGKQWISLILGRTEAQVEKEIKERVLKNGFLDEKPKKQEKKEEMKTSIQPKKKKPVFKKRQPRKKRVNYETRNRATYNMWDLKQNIKTVQRRGLSCVVVDNNVPRKRALHIYSNGDLKACWIGWPVKKVKFEGSDHFIDLKEDGKALTWVLDRIEEMERESLPTPFWKRVARRFGFKSGGRTGT